MKGVFKDRQLGSPERIRKKLEVKIATLVSSQLAGERENVRKAESKITELEEKVESAEKRARAAAARAVRAEIRCDRISDLEQQLQSTQQLLHTREEELKALTTQYKAKCDGLSQAQEQFSTQQQVLSSSQYTAQQKEEQLQSTQQLLHTREEELKALNTQFRATHVHTQEQFSTQQQALSHLQYIVQQTEEQLQARVRENAALANEIVTLQMKIVQMEQAMQSPKAGALYQAELPVQHTELQKKVAGDTEVLPPVTEDIQDQLKTLQADKLELEQQMHIKSVENQEQREILTTVENEKRKLQEELAKETFLESALADEVDILREDLMDREEELYRYRTQRSHHHGSDEVTDDNYTHTTSGKIYLNVLSYHYE